MGVGVVMAGPTPTCGGGQMALYTYRCEGCGKSFDKLGSYDDVNVVCKECKGTATRLAFYAPNFRMEDAEVPRGDPEWREAAKKRLKKDRDWDYDRALEHVRNHVVETEQGKALDMEAMNR